LTHYLEFGRILARGRIKVAKTERSPNYPAQSLPEAIEAARAVYAKQKMGEAPAEILALDMGHKSLTGAARTKIAAMRQYGLMDGRGNKLRLTDRAFQILQSPDAKEVAQASAQAAYTPPLFAEIQASKPDSSDEALIYWLRREKGFSADGAAKAVEAYKETVAVVGLASGSYNKGNEERTSIEIKRENPPGAPKPPIREDSPGASRHNVTGLLLEGGTIADVGFSGQPLSREGVDMLIDYFKLLRRALPPTVTESQLSYAIETGRLQADSFADVPSQPPVKEVKLDTHD
jgi:hypothetical protein